MLAMTPADHLQDNIAYLDETGQLNRKAFADAVGISVQAVGQLIRGESKGLKPYNLMAAAEFLNISMRDFVSIPMRDQQFKLTHRDAHALGVREDTSYYSNAADGRGLKPFITVPIVGRGKGGADGYFDEEQYPVGHGNGYIDHPTRDVNAFALRIEGDSMYPAIRHGQHVIVEPNAGYSSGEYVYVALNDGRKLVKQLGFEKSDSINLVSINNDHPPLTILKENVKAIYAITAIIISGAFIRDGALHS